MAAYCSGVGRCDGIGSLFGRFAGGAEFEAPVQRQKIRIREFQQIFSLKRGKLC